MVDGVVDDHELVLSLEPGALDHEVPVLHRGRTGHCKEHSVYYSSALSSGDLLLKIVY